jgi:cellulose biosynthesis protein BcsQ
MSAAHRTTGHAAPSTGTPDAPGSQTGSHPSIVAFWSAKGGAGTTVVAAALARRLAQEAPDGALLVDTAGDSLAALGMPQDDGPGLAGWLRARQTGLPVVTACPGLSVVHRGAGPLASERADELIDALATDARPTIVDCGTNPTGLAASIAERADHSVLVTRPCYLALRRTLSHQLPRPTGVVLVTEPGRVLSAQDVTAAVRAPVVTDIVIDPAVARAVDAGLLATRPPVSLDAGLSSLLATIGAPDHGAASTRAIGPAGHGQPEVSAW